MFLSLFTAALMLFQIGSTPADTVHLSELSVSKALEIAYRQHPQINILQQQIVAQEKQQVLSWGIDDPEIRYLREGMDNNTFMEQRWAITQKMEFPLSSYYRMKNERAITESLYLKLADLKNQVRADVKTSYTKLIYALRSGELSRQQVGLFENLRRAAQARSDMGESSDIDAMQANLQLQESHISMESTLREIMNARYDLFQTIGLEPENQTYNIIFPDTLKYITVQIDQQDVMNRLQDHPKLRQMEQQVESAGYRVKLAKSTYLPDLSVSYYRQDFGNDFNFYGFEVGISIPFLFMAKQSPKVQQSHALENAAQWNYEDVRLLIKKQAEQTWHSYESAKNNIERFRDNIQFQSQELVQMTQLGYSLGELDLLTLLEAQRTYLRTQEAYHRTLLDYYLTIIELERFLQTDIIYN